MSNYPLLQVNCIPLIKSPTTICPDCKNECNILAEEYNIRSICKFGHESNYTPNEFEKAQYRLFEIIPCEACENKVYENKCFHCLTCKHNLCEYCKNHHCIEDYIESNKSHNIVPYNQKNYYCPEHMKEFNYYCFDCKQNICSKCKNNHKTHKIKSFELNVEKLDKTLKTSQKIFENLRKVFENSINKMNSCFKEIGNTFEIFYKKNSSNRQPKTWQDFLNNKAYNMNHVIKDFQKLVNIANVEKNDSKFFEELINLYEKISFTNSGTFIYDIDKEIINNYIANNLKELEVKILGKEFVKNNKRNLKIEYNNRIISLQEKIKIDLDKIKDGKFSIQLKGFHNKLTDLSFLLDGSHFFIAAPDIHKINTKYVTNMSYAFNGCISLKCTPNISKLNLQKITHINYLFSNCTSMRKFINPNQLDLNFKQLISAKYIYYNCPFFDNKKMNIDVLLDDKRFEGLNDKSDDYLGENDYEAEKIKIIKKTAFYRNYMEYMNKYEILPFISNYSYSVVKDDKYSIDSKLIHFEEISSINYESKEQNLINLSKNDSLLKLCHSNKKNEAIRINLLQVNYNENKNNNKNIYNINYKNNKKRIFKIKRKCCMNIIKIKFSTNIINFAFFKSIVRYYSNTYFSYFYYLKNHYSNFINKKMNIKYDLNEVDLDISNLLNIFYFIIFSEVEGKNVYISLLNNCLLLFVHEKEGNMRIFNYPYYYLLEIFLHLNILELFNNFISSK